MIDRRGSVVRVQVVPGNGMIRSGGRDRMKRDAHEEEKYGAQCHGSPI
jgi:hypothetical protein